MQVGGWREEDGTDLGLDGMHALPCRRLPQAACRALGRCACLPTACLLVAVRACAAHERSGATAPYDPATDCVPPRWRPFHPDFPQVPNTFPPKCAG